MKKHYIILLGAFLFMASCQISENDSYMACGPKFYARMESDMMTKTVLDKDGSVFWLPQDEIQLFYFDGATLNSAKLVSDNVTPSREAVFSGAPEGVYFSRDVYAIYPYKEDNHIEAGLFSVSLPSSQTAIANSFDKTAFVSVAKSNNTDLFFRNVCGGVCFTVLQDDITSVTFKSNNSEWIAGKAFFLLDENNVPYELFNTDDGFSEITLTAPEGTTFIPGEEYYIVCYPQKLSNGFTLLLTKKDGSKAVREYTKEVEIKRSMWGVICDVDNSLIYKDIDSQIASEREAMHEIWRSLDVKNWNLEYWDSYNTWKLENPLEDWAGLEFTSWGSIKSIIIRPSVTSVLGTLPDVFDAFKDLETLIISGVNIPASIGRISSLKVFEGAGLTGELPDFSEMTNLRRLWVESSSLVGGIPKSIGLLQNLESLCINNSGLTGMIPTEIGDLSNLESISFDGNFLTGELPESLGNLVSLKEMNFRANRLTGKLPSSFGNLKNLEFMCLEAKSTDEQLDKQSNSLSGELPESMADLSNLKILWLSGNQFSGEIPDWIWSLSLEVLDLSDNHFTGTLSHNIANAKSLSELNLTGNSLTGEIPEEIWNMTNLSKISLSNNAFTGTLPSTISNLSNLYYFSVGLNNMSGVIPDEITLLTKLSYLGLHYNNFTGEIPDGIKDLQYLSTFWCCGNRLGGNISYDFKRIMQYWNRDNSWNWLIDDQQDGYGFIYDLYESKDYSKNETVIPLQTATQGNGINIVLLGDGFVDTDIQDGKYEQAMQWMYEALFKKEPFKSHKDYFNVYEIILVSKNGDESGETALGVKSMPGFIYEVNSSEVKSIIARLIPEANMEEVTISIATPFASDRDGACYFTTPSIAISHYNYYDDSWSKEEQFKSTVIHEVCGHGFGRLADEYGGIYEDRVISEDEIMHVKNYHQMGWYMNVDVTSDPQSVIWRHFLNVDIYVKEGVGIYEGGSTYTYGVWRPTYRSIMQNSSLDLDFNAPSREAIYKRIHRLAYGDTWEYSFDDFMTWDKQHSEQVHRPVSIAKSNNGTVVLTPKIYNCVKILEE